MPDDTCTRDPWCAAATHTPGCAALPWAEQTGNTWTADTTPVKANRDLPDVRTRIRRGVKWRNARLR